MSADAPIGEDDLQAYLDGRLSETRKAAVEAWLSGNPARAETLAAERRQRDLLRAAFASKAQEAIPARLRIAAIRQARHTRLKIVLRNVAAGLMLFAIGSGAGWLARGGGGVPETPELLVTRDAVAAHRTYVVEVAHPVEVPASQEAHLLKWLSKRLNRPLAAPDLGAFGFHLVGGRLLPAEGDAAAQLMYEDAAGHRLTVYVRAGATGETAFRFWQDGPIASFVWLDQGYGFAVSAEADRAQLLPIAEMVYRVLDSGPVPGDGAKS